MLRQNKIFLIYLFLATTTLAVYLQMYKYDFISYDDENYVNENNIVKQGITIDGLVWAFTTKHQGNWHPLTWLSHMLDCQLFGLNAGWHHITNLLLHIINAILLFALLKQMTGKLWRCFFVAAVFALHPLHVESVAWIAERKDVLCTLFWILTIAAYLNYAKLHTISWYTLSLFTFALGLMAKPMLVTLPFVLLLLDYWPLGRLQPTKTYQIVREKVPFFILSAISSVITIIAQQHTGALSSLEVIPPVTRIANTFISYMKYIEKMFWPGGLAVFYPHPLNKVSILQAAAALLLLLFISILVLRLTRNHKYLAVGWLWYLGTLVPVIGLIQVGDQAYADRYTYIPLIGLFIIIAWGVPELLSKWQYQKSVIIILMIISLCASAVCTRLQVGYWRNSMALFEHTLEVTENNHLAHCVLALYLHKQQEIDKAAEHNLKALRIKPQYPQALLFRGTILLEEDKIDEAIDLYNQALQIKPDYAEAHYNLGIAYFKKGNIDEAHKFWSRTIQLDPMKNQAYTNLGSILDEQGKTEQAIKYWMKAIQLNPDDPIAHNNLARVLNKQGNIKDAVIHYNEVLRLKPYDAAAHNSLGAVLVKQGYLEKATFMYKRGLAINPHDAYLHSNLGSALLQQGLLDEAIDELQKALDLSPDSKTYRNIAVAFALKGQIDEAIKHFKEAIELEPQNADTRYNFANALMEKGNIEEAIAEYRKVLKINTDYTKARLRLKNAIEKQEQLQTDNK